MPSNHLILCRSLLLSIFPSIRVFSNESVLRIRWPQYWRFSFSISPSNEYSGLVSFRVNPERFGLISLQSKGVSSVFSNSTWYLLFQTCPTPALGSAWEQKGTQASGGARHILRPLPPSAVVEAQWVEYRAGRAKGRRWSRRAPWSCGSLGGQVRIRVDVKRISGKGNQRSQKAQRSEEAWLGGVLSGKEVQSAKTSRGQSVGCDWGRRKCWGPVGGLEVTR